MQRSLHSFGFLGSPTWKKSLPYRPIACVPCCWPNGSRSRWSCDLSSAYEPTQKDHPEKPLSWRQQVCSRFRATARVVPRLSHQTSDIRKKTKPNKKKRSEDTEMGTNLPSVPTGNCQLLLTEVSRAWSGTRVPNHDKADPRYISSRGADLDSDSD